MKPVNAPDEPITRWRGLMIEIGFFLLAAPTARAAFEAPIRSASCWYYGGAQDTH
ncbi:hypothetical protein GobsT_67550 [Gemmata obscuriglobus]|nr:hypothetical protein GobsT_67550 [Gemmata obscuriglobus]VTS11254.1 unnamed protein product [Gemmata obscuriglobus UQM 2246]